MPYVPILSVIGYSNAGKTRCIAKLTRELTRRGYRVATAKHCHRGFQLDVEGKDSWKHKQAGAATTILTSGGQLAVITDLPEPITLEEMSRQLTFGADLLLVEGFSWEPIPKILVMSRAALAEEHVPSPQWLMAVVSKRQVPTELPHFSFREIKQLADWLEDRYLRPSHWK
jgi:molybdopterin-guanine dinucleotide biosynthesis protein B